MMFLNFQRVVVVLSLFLMSPASASIVSNTHIDDIDFNPQWKFYKGSGDLIAVGNGDATALTSYQARERVAFHGMCLGIVRSQKRKGSITVIATSTGLTAESITVLAQ